MPDDTGEIRCGVCGRPYLPGQEIRVISTTRGMVLIHKRCESALKPLGTVEAVVNVREDETLSASEPEKVASTD